MIDIQELEKAGYSDEALKELFEKDPADRPEGIARLIERQRDRVRAGVDRSLEEADFYRAIDDAYDVSHRQVTFTTVRRMLDKNTPQAEVVKFIEESGLSSMLTDVLDEKGRPMMEPGPSKRPLKRFDLPTFWNIFIPMCMAYTKVRASYLFNERDMWPPYKYTPQQMTTENKVACELITQRVTRMHQEMGLRSCDRQSILAMLQYSICFNFPMEPWYTESQTFNGEEKVMREGVRFDIPHPTRVFWDESYPVTSLNTDTGCEYVGYWKTMKYRDIQGGSFWNADKIAVNSASWQNSKGMNYYLQELYPCNVKFPVVSNNGVNVADRESHVYSYSATESSDQWVGVSIFFEKIVPKDFGLFDYEHPVWFRFIYAGDDTVLDARPFAYAPGPVFVYDHDENRWRNASLVTELIPFQDHLSNLLSQYILAVKQNLDQVVFWNRGILSDDQVKVIQNLGERRFRQKTFIPFEPREQLASGTNIREATHVPDTGDIDTGQILRAVESCMAMAERMLGFSSQELGTANNYQPSATEVQVVEGARSTRIRYTGSFVDDAIHARKSRLYDALIAYSTDELFGLVADLTARERAKLKESGFTIEEGDGAVAGIKVDIKRAAVNSFVAARDGVNRTADARMATAMINIFQMIFASQAIVEQVGVKTILKRFNQILEWADVPGDWRFDDEAASTPEEAMAQMSDLEKQLAPIMDGIAKRFEQTDQAIATSAQQAGEAIQATQQAVQQLAQRGQESAQQAVAAAQQADQQVLQALDQKLAALQQAIAQELNNVRTEVAEVRDSVTARA